MSRDTDQADDLPSNPYAVEAASAPRLEDRPGYPANARRSAYGHDLSDEAQLGNPAAERAALKVNLRGRLKSFDVIRGYGFMARDDGGPDVFLHYATLKSSGYRSFIPGVGCGMAVEAVDRGRGLTATRIYWLEWTPNTMPVRGDG